MSLDTLKKLAADEGLPMHTVAAELVQIAFLEALYAQKESAEIVFHGGTCIRLLHGGYRYSEDLDFAVPQLSRERLIHAIESSVLMTERILTTLLGTVVLELSARPDKTAVAAWWLKLSPEGMRGKIHVKIECGRYPAYSPQPMPITLRNPLLSLQPITVSISLEELLADKITALAGRTHLKHRDLFDIWYLTTVFKPAPNYDLLRMKFSDYHVLTPVATLKRRLEELEPRGIAHTMERFLPANHRRAFSLNNYCDIVESNKSLIQTLVNTLDAWSDHT